MTEQPEPDRPTQRWGDSWLYFGLGVLAGLMVLSIWLSVTWNRTFDEVRLAGIHRNDLSHAVGEVYTHIQEAEIGQYAYVLTLQAEDLAAYQRARDVLPEALARLDGVSRSEPELQHTAAAIRALATERLAEIQAVVDLAAGGDQAAARGRLLERRAGAGGRSLRNAMAGLQRRSDTDRAIAIATAEQNQSRLHLSIMASSVLSLIGASLAILMLMRSNARMRSEITRRIATSQELRAAEARNNAFFEHTDDYLFIVRRTDRIWRFDAINPNTERLFGRPAAEIVGMAVGDLLDPVAAERAIRAFDRCRAEGLGVRYEEGQETRFGVAEFASRVFDVSLMPLVEGDEPVTRIIGSARDVTAAKQTEMALAQSQKLEAIGQLTGGVAHDFNNVLQVVTGNLELSLRHVPDERVTRRLQAAVAAAQRGQRLVQQLLTFARRQPMSLSIVSPMQVIGEIEGVLRTTVGDRIMVDWRLAADCWPVRLDRTQLENAVINLVINARDAMPDGGTLLVEVENVRLDRAAAARLPDGIAGEHVCIRVRDSGTGIPADVLPKVFQPFFTTKPPGKGTGLGLAMVQGFVRQAGGFMTLDTAAGEGTTVSLYLPRTEGEASDGTAAPTDLASHGERILVVEDEAEVRIGTVEQLRAAGYRVEDTDSADAALERLASGARIDLLLADIVLPGSINGVDLARRAQASRPDLAVLFMSGHAAEPAVRDAVSGGEALLLTKPFRAEQLARAVRQALAGDERRAASFEPGSERIDFRPAATGAAVLIVEDDPLVRAVAVDALTSAGYRCIETGLGAEALSVARDESVLVSVMITDLGLPDMEGRALLEEVRRLRHDLPALICSGYGARDALAALVEPGGTARTEVLGKPYSPEMLVRLVEEIVDGRTADSDRIRPLQPSTP